MTVTQSDGIDLDLRGLKCPLPVLHARRALSKLQSGHRLIVRCTDPLAAIDIPHMVAQDGHTLEQSRQEGGILTFHIRKATAADS
jgi:tRNA 2-thiouridine synthesizing protein A